MDTIADLAERIRVRRGLPAPDMCRAIRRAAGVSQQELAEAIGVSRVAVTHWERGERRPRPDHLARYAQALRLMQGVTDAA